MTNEERDIISRFVAKFGGAQQGSSWGSCTATTAQPPLPPVDPEADQWIASLFAQYPEARYRITQMAFVQEAALAEAQHRIERLQWELQQAQQAQQLAAQPQQSRGIFGGLFGGSAPRQPAAAVAPPPPQYAAYAPQPQMFQQQNNGFLGSALRTAAGVAGGMVLGNAIMDMFGGRQGFGGGGFGGGGFGGGGFGGGMVPNETIINNYNDGAAGQPDPWGGAGTGIGNTDSGSTDIGSTDIGSTGQEDWSSQDNGNQSIDNSDQSNDWGGDAGGDMGGDSGGGDWGN